MGELSLNKPLGQIEHLSGLLPMGNSSQSSLEYWRNKETWKLKSQLLWWRCKTRNFQSFSKHGLNSTDGIVLTRAKMRAFFCKFSLVGSCMANLTSFYSLTRWWNFIKFSQGMFLRLAEEQSFFFFLAYWSSILEFSGYRGLYVKIPRFSINILEILFWYMRHV